MFGIILTPVLIYEHFRRQISTPVGSIFTQISMPIGSIFSKFKRRLGQISLNFNAGWVSFETAPLAYPSKMGGSAPPGVLTSAAMTQAVVKAPSGAIPGYQDFPFVCPDQVIVKLLLYIGLMWYCN